MRVDKVWWEEISTRLSEEKKARTVEIGAAGVDGWDLGDRGVEGRGQSRPVGQLFETLDRDQRQPSVSPATQSYLHRGDPVFTLSLGNGPPLASDARLRAMGSIRGRNECEEKGQEQVLCETDGHLKKPVAVCRRRGGEVGGRSGLEDELFMSPFYLVGLDWNLTGYPVSRI